MGLVIKGKKPDIKKQTKAEKIINKTPALKKKKVENLTIDGMYKYRNDMMEKMYANLTKLDLGTVYKMSDPLVPTKIKRVLPTGLVEFDIICARTPAGRSGFPIGRQVEIYGPPGCGKTSIACQVAGSVQKRLGWGVTWLEFENKFDPDRAKLLGMDTDSALFLQPECLEDCIDIILEVLENTPERNKLPDDMKHFGNLVIVASVSQMPSRTELLSKKGMDSNNIGVFQRKMSQAQRRITNALSKRNVTIMWVNQTRAKLGFGFGSGGEMTTTYGGNALKFAVAQRWNMWSQKKGDNGMLIHFVNQKNNSCGMRPFLKAEAFMSFSKGFDYIDSWARAMPSLFICDRKGQSLIFKEGKFKGSTFTLNKLRDMYESDPEVFFEYERLMKDFIHNYHVLKKEKTKKE